MKDVFILAIESSCDETSMAIIKNGNEVVALTILSQISTHANYGGVVPEIASRMHAENITLVLEETLHKANMNIEQMDAIAVTYAPGLTGSLLVGVECAKAISLMSGKPLIKVHHIAGHIYANNLNHQMQFPLLALVVSGGHTQLVLMKDDYQFEVLGQTLDDAVGECYDKVARVLGLSYPGGPNVDKLAKEGYPTYELPRPMLDQGYNMSFSGLKSYIINLVHNETQRGREIRKADLATSFQKAAVEQITRKISLVLQNYDIHYMIIAGGVSANHYLREEVKKVADQYHVSLHVPDFLYCTDNAAMIGAAAYPLYKRKEFCGFDVNAKSNESLF